MIWLGYITGGGITIWIIGSLALIGSSMSMLETKMFHILTERPYNPSKDDGWLKFISFRRDVRLFTIFIGGVLNQVVLSLIILAVVSNIKTILRLFHIKRIFRKVNDSMK